MPNERELRTAQEKLLYDLLMLKFASPEAREEMLDSYIARAESGMTVDELALVLQRAERVSKKTNKKSKASKKEEIS